jgi:IclR family pca regulon transcriptional regulator
MAETIESTLAEGATRDIVGSLERGLGVLEILATHPEGLTLTETAERAGLTRAGARRLLLTLVAAGHARQDGRRFLLTAKLLSLARTWLQDVSMWDYALPFLREVSAATNESCSAAVLAGTDVVYVARVPGERIMSVALNVGTRLPAYCTSMGRVLLSDLPAPDLDNLLRRSDIRANTKKTLMNRVEIAHAVRRAAEAGYAVVDEELEIGLRSIAVPVRDRAGRIVAAINVPAQSSRYSVQELERKALPHLRKAAASIANYFVVQ